MENIILNIIFYFLLTFLCFLIIAENYAKNKSNQIREAMTSFQQVINSDPFHKKYNTWDNIKDLKIQNNEFNILKYIEDGVKKNNTNTIQEVYKSKNYSKI